MRAGSDVVARSMAFQIPFVAFTRPFSMACTKVIAKARKVVIVTCGHGEGLTAVGRPDARYRPAIQRRSDEPVEVVEVVRLPDKGHCHHVATVLVRTLTIFELRIIGVNEGAVQATRTVKRVALKRLAPGVVPFGADVAREALLQRDLKAVVVGVLVGANDEHVAIERARRRRTDSGVGRRVRIG